VWKVLAEEGIDAEVELVASTPTRRPSGSGTRKPDDPVGRARPVPRARTREHWRLGCRDYATPEGLKGTPTVERLREALMIREGAGDAGLHR
jgi:hypothetical protein